MTQMTARVRNRFYDAIGGLRNNRWQQLDQRQQQADIRRKRMTCSESLNAYRQSQDWTGSMGMSPSERFRVIEEAQPKRRLFSSQGIRWDAAIALIILVAVICGGILLAKVAGMGADGRTITKLSSKIETISEKNDRLLEMIAEATSDASICTAAVNMNLISSNGATTIRLTAPGNAQYTLSSAEEASENEALIGRMSANAGE